MKTRNCLKCDKAFKSCGSGNRVCHKCNRVNKQVCKRTSNTARDGAKGTRRSKPSTDV